MGLKLVKPSSGGGGEFDGDHNDLDGRSANDAHPISAITNLQGSLNTLAQAIADIPAGVDDHGALGGLADDDHSQYALADGSRGSFATAAQGVLADSAVQPAALSVVETLARYEAICIAAGDETTVLEVCVAKVTFRMPFAMTLASVRASLTVASTSGTPTVDIKESGATIFSTKLTIDVNEKTSTTAVAPAVLSDTALADDAEITINIDVAGSNATGLKIWLIGSRL